MNGSAVLLFILAISSIVNLLFIDTIAGFLLLISQLIMVFAILVNYRKMRDIFSPIVITYVGMLIPFSIKGLYILGTGKFESINLVLPLVLYIAFMCSFSLAVFMPTKKVALREYVALSRRKIKDRYLISTSLLLATVGFAVYGLKMGSLNPSILVSNVLGNRIEFQNSGGLYIQTLVLLLLQSALYVNCIIYFNGKSKKFLIAIFILFMLNFAVTFTLGGRGMIIVPIMTIFFYKYKIANQVDWVKVVLFFVTVVVFSGWYGMYRDGVTDTSVSLNLVGLFGNILDRYVQFDNFIRVVENPVDYMFGQSLVDFLSSPIPRSVLPNKPYNFNSQMTQIYHPRQAANSLVTDFTMLSELLLNFGVLGVVIGGYVFGRIISYFNSLYNNLAQNHFFLFWYPFFMLKPMSYLYGGLINSTVNMMVILEAPILIFLWVMYSRKIKNG